MLKSVYFEKLLKYITVDSDFNDVINYTIALDADGMPVRPSSENAEYCYILESLDELLDEAYTTYKSI